LNTDYDNKFANTTNYLLATSNYLNTDYDNKFANTTNYLLATSNYLNIDYDTKFANITKYIIDTSNVNITVTLPSSGVLGDEVMVVDGTGNANTNEITIARNGHKIQGGASDMTVNTARAAFTLVYYNSTHGWLLTNV
jgi:hypothetical protein